MLLAGKYKIPFTDSIKTADGKDYDLHFGAQGSLLFKEKSFGTDGINSSTILVPQAGVGFYLFAIPSGESRGITLSRGIRNLLSYDAIKTNQNNHGGGITFGYAISPPVGGNISFSDK
jgi:hypothetical protein